MSWLKEYLKGEKAKVAALEGRRRRTEYIWQYYKLWIIGFAALIGFLTFVVVHRLTTPTDSWFYATFVNTGAELSEGSEFYEDFVDYAGFDTKEKLVIFNNNCFFDPFSAAYNEYQTYFTAYVEAGTMDVATMSPVDLEEEGRSGRFLDLSSEQANGLAERYADRLIYSIPFNEENGTDPIPVGIDISDSILVTKYHAYNEGCALAVSKNVPHMDAVETFLDYLYEEDVK